MLNHVPGSQNTFPGVAKRASRVPRRVSWVGKHVSRVPRPWEDVSVQWEDVPKHVSRMRVQSHFGRGKDPCFIKWVRRGYFPLITRAARLARDASEVIVRPMEK